MAGEILVGDRLLDPVQIELGKARDAPARLDRIERLIVVDHQGDLGADRLPHPGDDRRITGEIAVAYLDLDGAKSRFDRLRDCRQVGLEVYEAVAVIGRERARLAAKQGHDRHAAGARKRVPERHVEARDRHADQALPPEQAKAAVELAHQRDGRERLAGKFGAKTVDQPHQRPQRKRRVGEDIAAPDESMRGADVDQDQRRAWNLPHGGADRPPQRCAHRACGDCFDPRRAVRVGRLRRAG